MAIVQFTPRERVRKIPRIRIEEVAEGKFLIHWGNEDYKLFTSPFFEDVIQTEWETDDATGETYPHIIINPRLLPKEFWEPIFARMIGGVKEGTATWFNIGAAFQYETAYCNSYLTERERAEYSAFLNI